MSASWFRVILLAALALAGIGCGPRSEPASGSVDAAAPPAPAAPAHRAAVDRLALAIEERYSYRDRLGLDWKALVAAHRPALEGAASAAEFARVAATLLGNARDAHIWIDVGKERTATHPLAAVPNVSLDTLRKVVTAWKQRSRCLASGKLGADVGYVLVTSVERGKCDDVPAAFAAALGDLAGAHGLVLDLRGNQGGDETLAAGMAGRFVDAPVLYAKHELRDAKAPGGFTAQTDRVLRPIADGPRWRAPVVVLMGPLNMSSAEAFLLMMRAAGAPLVGAQSRGASGNPQPVELGNGVVVYLPSWRAMLPDGTRFEGIGIAPDVVVTDLDHSERDPVIAAGLAALATANAKTK